MSESPLQISVIIPVYNEENVIEDLVSRVWAVLKREEWDGEVLVINDGSSDNSADRARRAGATVLSHPYNIGNGAAVKTGFRAARGKILVMMDGDGQHDPDDIPRLVSLISEYDMVVGSRIKGSQAAMHRNVANKAFNLLATYISKRKIEDLTSGFRVIRAGIARQFIYLLPNTFSYPSTLTLSVIQSGFSLTYVPIQTTRRVGTSKIRPLRDGLRFLLIIMKIAVFFAPLRIFLPVSLLLFFLGFGWYLIAIFYIQRGFPPVSIVVMLTSVIIFFMGLISEQVAQLRLDRRDISRE